MLFTITAKITFIWELLVLKRKVLSTNNLLLGFVWKHLNTIMGLFINYITQSGGERWSTLVLRYGQMVW